MPITDIGTMARAPEVIRSEIHNINDCKVGDRVI